jgi:catalase
VDLQPAVIGCIENLTNAEAEAIIAKDRESHQRDLYEAIERGDFV